MGFDADIYLLLMLTSLFAGFVDGVAGGGGLLVLPALLTAGVPPHLSLGTNKLIGTMGVIASVHAYIKSGILRPRYWFAAMIAVFFGGLLGALTTQFVSSAALEKVLPVLILLVAVYMIIPRAAQHFKRDLDFKPKQTSSVAAGSVLGFYDGFCGPGIGGFWVAVVMALYKLDILQASAIAKLMNLLSNIAAFSTFMVLDHVDYRLGLIMSVTMVLVHILVRTRRYAMVQDLFVQCFSQWSLL